MLTMRLRYARVFTYSAVLLLTLAALAACGVDPESASPPTPQPDLKVTAAALFPTPQPTITPTPTPVARGDDSEAIARLIGELQTAVLLEDSDTYLSLVDRSDPVFAREHTQWVEDWETQRVIVLRYELTVRNLVVTGDEATGDLTALWSTVTEAGQVTRGADYPVRFTLGDDGQWRYAGQVWITSEGEDFHVRSMPGLEGAGTAIAAMMPDIYRHVSTSLAHEPANTIEVKLYDNPWALIATVRLSITREISGWRAPDEALKLLAMPLPDESTLAQELTRYMLYDLAGADSAIPYWLSEGVAAYISSEYWTFTDRNRRITQVQNWQSGSGLADWDAMRAEESTPDSLQTYVQTQGYAFARYITETYGAEQRNAWLKAMADESLEAATTAVFAVPFTELSAGFLDWVAAQE